MAGRCDNSPVSRSGWRYGGLALPLLLLGLVGLASPGKALQSGFSEQEVRFSNGQVELAGTLISPAQEGPHPAMVFLHGSGPATRQGARPYAEAFVGLGVASLIFDKRGSGDSGGSWVTASLDDLAEDGMAAVDYLRSRSDIDPERIGFWGVSQAGWVATLAASRSEHVGFMILISGGGASPRESEMYSYRQAFEAAGLSEAEQTQAERALDRYFEYLSNGKARSEVVAAIEEGRDSRWYPLAPLDRILPSEENRSNWSWVANWDPVPHIRNLRMPILLMFGALDRDHPTDIAVEKWRNGLQEAGNDGVTLMVFPGAGHGIRMGAEHSGRAPFADGYAEVQLGWLWLHVINAGQN